MGSLAHLNKYFWKYKWLLFLGIFFTFCSNFFGVVPAQLVRYALNLVTETIGVYFLFKGFSLQTAFYEVFASALLFYGLLIICMAFMKGFFLFLVRQTIIVMSRHIEYDLKNEIYEHYQTLPLSFYRKQNTGDLMARISEDVSKVRMYVGPSIMYGMNLISVFILVIYYMYHVNQTLMWYVLLPLPFLSISIYYVNSLIIKKSEEIQKGLSSISTFAQEAFSGIRVLKSFVREDNSIKDFDSASAHYRKKSIDLVKIDSLFTPLISLLVGFSTLLVVFIGSKEVMAGQISIGNIAEFIMYVFMLTWPVTALGWTSSQIQRAAASQQRINEFLNYQSELVDGKGLKQVIVGNWKFENVSFTYPGTDIEVLHNLNFEIKAGDSVAILGTTGSGKSTLALLMGRFYDPSSGIIYLDGINLKDWDMQYLRNNLGFVPQDVFLFSTSIADNIKFGNEALGQEQIENAAELADVHENIIDFPQQYETILGERGVTLSGGQKQRVSIARALAKNPEMLVLDDCLSAVDTHTEHQILSNLKKVLDGKTSVIISHRVSSAKLAKQVLVLDQGSIVEKGTHTKLMSQKGAYFELYQKQLEQTN
ncbi:ABC transporter ATP-binding protein [Sandaracinomonas limnophila]|uniref:ABC transporter ATP-binding protein n=1 Tax=Sandaracinomonas limnophila TaxID=1862386 RepID=A0A437PR45_9BACT|nr:ABC transporter ATP-binding protein [Sandaracinomonas limnophila]RVU24710.1 ABC transporter ATP-binding protein [Sandaracinomonas limnophila]